MKIFVPVLAAILVAAAIIFCVKACNDEIERQAALRESQMYSSIYSKPTPTPKQPAKTWKGEPAVIVTAPVKVNTPRGEVIIPRGSKLKMVREAGTAIYVDYDGYSVAVPASSTSKYLP